MTIFEIKRGELSVLCLPLVLLGSARNVLVEVPVTDPNIAYSPYNWFNSSTFAQSPNPGAYLKLGFTGTSIAVDIDVSPLKNADVPASQYPLVRYSVDGGPAKTLQLSSTTTTVPCASNLAGGDHTLLLQYVAGYVFLDFWTPKNVLRVTGFALDPGAKTVQAFDSIASKPAHVLFLGDSITNGDDDVATREKGITNEVDTQDATIGYPAVVASGLGAEYGVVAYGGASWDGRAADGHTPGLMKFYSMLDSVHSRLVDGKLSPIPDEIFINMGENAPPEADDVPRLLAALRNASSPRTNIFLIVPFSGRSRAPLSLGYNSYEFASQFDAKTFILDIGSNPYLTDAGPTMLSIDGQHPLATLHAFLGAQLLSARTHAMLESHHGPSRN